MENRHVRFLLLLNEVHLHIIVGEKLKKRQNVTLHRGINKGRSLLSDFITESVIKIGQVGCYWREELNKDRFTYSVFGTKVLCTFSTFLVTKVLCIRPGP